MAVIKSAGNGSALSVEMMGGAGPTPRRGSSTVDRTPWKRRRGKSAAGGREDPSGTRKKKKKKKRNPTPRGGGGGGGGVTWPFRNGCARRR